MFLFYTPNIDRELQLSEEESQHAVRVLRLQAGDHILLTDGRGTTYEAELTLPHPKHCQFRVLSQEMRQQKPFHIHVAIAPTKNMDRLEWMVEKCTEIGIDEITLLLCRYSERKEVKTERLEKIIVSAAKQSLKAFIPKLNPMTPFREFILGAKEEQCFIAHCYKEDKRELFHEVEPGKSVLVLIGPEGDFSEQEVQWALSKGFKPVSLGPERLRTETAGIVACHTIAIKNL